MSSKTILEDAFAILRVRLLVVFLGHVILDLMFF